MDSQYKLLSELLSDQAAFITSPKTSLANYWGALPPCPPVSTGLEAAKLHQQLQLRQFKTTEDVDILRNLAKDCNEWENLATVICSIAQGEQ